MHTRIYCTQCTVFISRPLNIPIIVYLWAYYSESFTIESFEQKVSTRTFQRNLTYELGKMTEYETTLDIKTAREQQEDNINFLVSY